VDVNDDSGGSSRHPYQYVRESYGGYD